MWYKIYYLFMVTACLLGGSRITRHEGRSGCSVALKHDAVAENASFRIAFYKMRFRSIGRGWMQMQEVPCRARVVLVPVFKWGMCPWVQSRGSDSAPKGSLPRQSR
ncbi:hypothetical protein BGZ57DRAFT_891812 [Hyaloscypha finlandica]|nr:hypothetical protein BGZ57DRAFT_891812 [Hyaloscypha finlandica]